MKVAVIILLFSVLTGNSAFAGTQVTDLVKADGVKRCLSTVQELEGFLTEDKDYGSWALWATEQPDQQIVNATIELTYANDSALVDFTVAPLPDGTCSISYTRSFHNEKNCLATSKENFMADAAYVGEVNKNVMRFNDDGSTLLLMPAGNGCFVQKKEVLIRFKNQEL